MKTIRSSRRVRLEEARDWAGYRSAHFARTTGTLVVVVDAVEQGLSDGRSDGRWAAVCDDHKTLVTTDTLQLARYHAADPTGWCEDCQAAAAEED